MPFNLNTILDKTPYGGFRAGMADQDAIMQSNSGLANDSIHRSKIAQDMETTALKRPLDAVEQARKIAQEESDLRDIQAGGRDKDRQVKRDQEQADLTRKLDDNQFKKLEQKIQGVQAVGQIFGDDANPANMALNWESAKAAGKEYGFDIGEYNEQNAAKVLRMKQQTPMAMKLYENQVKERQRLEADLITKGAAHSYDMDKQIQNQGFLSGEAKLNRASNERVASTYRSGSGSGGSGDPKNWGQLETQTFIKANKYLETGDPKFKPSDAEIQLIENKMARAEALSLIKEDPMFSIHFMNSEQTGTPLPPDVVAKISAALPKYMAMTNSGRMVAALRAKAGSGSGGSSAPKGMGGGTGSLFSGGGTVTPQSNKAPASSGGFTLRGSRPAGG